MSFITHSVNGLTMTFTTMKEAVDTIEKSPSMVWKIMCFDTDKKSEYRFLPISKSEKVDAKSNEKLCSLSKKYEAEPVDSTVQYWVRQKTAELDDDDLPAKWHEYSVSWHERFIRSMTDVYTDEEFKRLYV